MYVSNGDGCDVIFADCSVSANSMFFSGKLCSALVLPVIMFQPRSWQWQRELVVNSEDYRYYVRI